MRHIKRKAKAIAKLVSDDMAPSHSHECWYANHRVREHVRFVGRAVDGALLARRRELEAKVKEALRGCPVCRP